MVLALTFSPLSKQPSTRELFIKPVVPDRSGQELDDRGGVYKTDHSDRATPGDRGVTDSIAMRMS